MKKTLVLGLGGTGFEVARRAKSLLSSMYGSAFASDKFPIRFLCIDFDLQSQAIDPLTVDETLFVDGTAIIEDALLAFQKTDPGYRNDVAPWIDSSVLSMTQNHKGAQQLRSLGRALLFRQSEPIRARVRQALAFAGDADLVPHPDTGGTEVVVIASSCGGTGAGVLLDLAAWTRQGRDHRVTVMTAVRAAYDLHDVNSRTYRNYYCLLKELNALASKTVPVHDYKAATHAWRFDNSPINRLLVFDNAGGGPGVGRMTLDQMYAYMADVVALWPVVVHEAEQAQAFTAPAARPIVAGSLDTLAASAGCAMFTLPSDADLTDYVHARAWTELLPESSGRGDTRRYFEAEAREALHNAAGVDAERVFDQPLTACLHARLPETKQWIAAIQSDFKTRIAGSKAPSVLYDASLYDVYFRDGGVTAIPFPIRDTSEVALGKMIDARLQTLMKRTETGRTFFDVTCASLLLKALESALKEVHNRIADLQVGLAADRRLFDETRDKRFIEPKELIGDLVFNNYVQDIASLASARDAFAQLRATCAFERKLQQFQQQLQEHTSNLETYAAIIEAVDVSSSADLVQRSMARGWGVHDSPRKATASYLGLLELKPACELVFAEWREKHQIGPVLVDALEKAAPRERSTENQLRESFATFLQERPVTEADRMGIIRTIFASPAVRDFATRAGNRKAFEEGGQKNLVTNNIAFVVTEDDELYKSLASATQPWNIDPNGVRRIRRNIRINDRELVGLVYLHAADTLLNLPEIAQAKRIHDVGTESKPFFASDRRFETAAGVPELVTDLVNHPMCHNCGFDLASFPRESTYECPRCKEAIRVWCGRSDCDCVIDASYSEMACPKCRRPRLPLYFKCDKHGWQQKTNDLCPECVAAGEPNPATWKRSMSSSECPGCKRDGKSPVQTFSGRVMEILDGIDNDLELTDAQALYSDGINFIEGDCIRCGHKMMPVCPHGPADPSVGDIHYPRHSITDGHHVYDCTKIHVDSAGKRLTDVTILTCAVCRMPLARNKSGSTVNCDRCGTKNLVCAFHNTSAFATKKNRNLARQLVNPDDVKGRNAAPGTLCPLCNIDITTSFPAPVAAPATPTPAAPATPVTRTCGRCGFSALMDPSVTECPVCGNVL